MSKNTIDVIREYLIDSINNSDEGVIKPNLALLTLESLLFKYTNEERTKKTFNLPSDILSRIDFTGVSFDGFDCEGVDFSALHNVTIVPNTVFNHSLKGSILIGVTIDGSLEGIDVTDTIFEKEKSKVKNRP